MTTYIVPFDHHADPLAHICLTLPSAVRDRFGHVATNSIHQANLNIVSGYKDQLVQDAQLYPLGRKRAEAEFRWAELMDHLKGYFVSTMGRNEEMIRAYIQNQEVEDKQLDQLQLLR